jgi:glutamate---cysteine ligase / carboxylate-amine ligase
VPGERTRRDLSSTRDSTLVPEDAFRTGAPEGTVGAEEELWLSDPETLKLADGAQQILAGAREGHFSGELIDCEIESNTGVHGDAAGVAADLASRRRELLAHADRLGRLLGTSGTHPLGDWREQEIIDKPHYQRLKKKLGWLIRRNNTFSLHVHYAVQGREKAIYVFDRVREYVPHFLALSVNSPFWQGEYTDMHSARVLMFSRAYHRAGLPGPLESWDTYNGYVDYLVRAGVVDSLAEIWWDVRLHPGLSTVEIRAFDAQNAVGRSEALVALAAAVCDMLVAEYEAGDPEPILPNREIEENKWSAQRDGLDGHFIDHASHELVETRGALEALISRAAEHTNRDLSNLWRVLGEPTESVRQLEVWRETGSLGAVVEDLAARTRHQL